MTDNLDCSLLRLVYSDGPVLSNAMICNLVNDSHLLAEFISGDLTAVAKILRSLTKKAKVFIDQIDTNVVDKNDVVEASRFFAVLYRETRKVTSRENWSTAFVSTMLVGVNKYLDCFKSSLEMTISDNEKDIDTCRYETLKNLRWRLKILFGTSYSNGRMLTGSLADNEEYLMNYHFSYYHESCEAIRDSNFSKENLEEWGSLLSELSGMKFVVDV